MVRSAGVICFSICFCRCSVLVPFLFCWWAARVSVGPGICWTNLMKGIGIRKGAYFVVVLGLRQHRLSRAFQGDTPRRSYRWCVCRLVPHVCVRVLHSFKGVLWDWDPGRDSFRWCPRKSGCVPVDSSIICLSLRSFLVLRRTRLLFGERAGAPSWKALPGLQTPGAQVKGDTTMIYLDGSPDGAKVLRIQPDFSRDQFCRLFEAVEHCYFVVERTIWPNGSAEDMGVTKGFWCQIFNLQLREKCTTSMSHGTDVVGVSSGPVSQRHTFGNVVFQESLQNKPGIARQVRLLDLLLREAIDSGLLLDVYSRACWWTSLLVFLSHETAVPPSCRSWALLYISLRRCCPTAASCWRVSARPFCIV